MITISLFPSSAVSQSFPLSHQKPEHHPDTFPFSALSPYPTRASGCPRNALRIQFPASRLPRLAWLFSEVPLVQFSSVAQSCPTLCNPMDCSMPGFPVHHQLLELAQTHVHWVSNAIQPSHSLSSPFLLPSVFPSIRLFSKESVLCIMWPKDWSFSFSISSSNEYSGLISFRMDWLDLLAVQGTLKSLLQHHSSKASIFRCSVFFIVQLSHPYMTTGNIIALTNGTLLTK